MRAARTYRAERRLAYRTELVANSWRVWNSYVNAAAGFGVGSGSEVRHATSHAARSKYMPHIGNKERSRPSHGREGTE